MEYYNKGGGRAPFLILLFVSLIAVFINVVLVLFN